MGGLRGHCVAEYKALEVYGGSLALLDAAINNTCSPRSKVLVSYLVIRGIDLDVFMSNTWKHDHDRTVLLQYCSELRRPLTPPFLELNTSISTSMIEERCL